MGRVGEAREDLVMDADAAAIADLIAAGDDQTAFTQVRARLSWPRGKDVAELATWLALSGHARDPARRDDPRRARGRGGRRSGQSRSPVRARLRADRRRHARDRRVGPVEVPACSSATAKRSCASWCRRSERALAYRDALAILEDHPALRGRSFLCRYLYAFNAVMSGNLAIARAALAALAPDGEETEAMRAAIVAMLARADRVAGAASLDERDLRGWHYVLTGGLVSHQSPYGFDSPMHGRYAWLQDSFGRIATGLDRLAQLAPAAPCVYAPPGRGHEIVAHAVAKRMNIPFAPWPAIGVPAPGLVVLYDLAELPAAEIPRLLQRRPDQILFAHASPWTRDFPIAPDVTTLLYQASSRRAERRSSIPRRARSGRAAADPRSRKTSPPELAGGARAWTRASWRPTSLRAGPSSSRACGPPSRARGRDCGPVDRSRRTTSSNSATRCGVKKILVVEDDPVNQMILTDFLAKPTDMKLSRHRPGPEGIERFERDVPDLCLNRTFSCRGTDNGFELVRYVR